MFNNFDIIGICAAGPVGLVSCIFCRSVTVFNRSQTVGPANFRTLDLNSKDWNYFYSLKDVNAAWKVLSDYLTETINTHAPKTTRRIKGKPCPWITPDIKALMSERDKMLRKSRKTKNELDISSYKNLRNRVNIMVRNAVSTGNFLSLGTENWPKRSKIP